MAGALTTVNIKDAGEAVKAFRAWLDTGAYSLVPAPLGAPNDPRATDFDETETSIIRLARASGFTGAQILSFLQNLASGETVPVAMSSSDMWAGSTLVVPKFVAIAASTSGNNTIVAAVSGKKIRVLSYNLIANGAVNAKFQSGAGGTDLTGLKYMPAAGNGIAVGHSPVGWFETASGSLLNLSLSAAVAVGGELTYVEI